MANLRALRDAVRELLQGAMSLVSELPPDNSYESLATRFIYYFHLIPSWSPFVEVLRFFLPLECMQNVPLVSEPSLCFVSVLFSHRQGVAAACVLFLGVSLTLSCSRTEQGATL